MTKSPADADDSRARLSAALGEVARGRHEALADVYQRTSAKLFGICLRILNDREAAEEALQDVYVSVWKRADSFDPGRASPVTWLAVIARNRAIDRLRAIQPARRAVPLAEARNLADSAPDPLAVLESGAERDRLGGCIDELEQRSSSAIRSTFFGGLSYVMLAERERIPVGTMKSRIRRALQQLRACLER